MRQKTVITKLLQSVSEPSVTELSITKCEKVLLKSVTDCFYKVHQFLQSVTVATN